MEVGDMVELVEDIPLRGTIFFDDKRQAPRQIDTVFKAGTKAKIYWYEKENARMNVVIDGLCIFVMADKVRAV